MRLRTRLVLMVGGSVSLGIIAVTAVLTFLAWRSILDQAEAEGMVIARLLAQSATVSEQAVSDVSALLDREMAAEGLLTSHLADAADKAGMSDQELSRRLMEIAARSSIGELLVTDDKGKLRAGSLDDGGEKVDATTLAGLPPGTIDTLLDGSRFSEPLGAGKRPFGGTPTRYVGVRGVGEKRAVLVGRDLQYVSMLSQDLGVQRLLDTLQQTRAVEALWIFGPDGRQIASTVASRRLHDGTELSPAESALVQKVLSGVPVSAIGSGGWISVAAAMPDAYGVPAGVALARLSTASLDRLLSNYFRIGGGIALATLLIGIAMSVLAGRRIAAPMMRIAQAAAAVDARDFVPGSLGPVAARKDELGHLARTFESMAEQVFAREEELERQVQQRTIELQQKNEQLDQAKRRLEADLELAKLLQATILPHAFPADGKWYGTARMTPALQMAGDFYDYFQMDGRQLGLVIADVSGKGVAPAFFMAVSRAALREASRHNFDPGDCLAAANDRLCDQNPLDMFVTTFYAVIDEGSGEIRYSNGGHNRPYVIGLDGTVTEVPLTGDMALGVMAGMPYSSATLTLQPGETLFLYTDGVSEAMNPSNEEFGEPRLEAILRQCAQLSVEEVLDAVTTAVQQFAGAAPQSDDITCLVVRYVGDQMEYAPPKSAEVLVAPLDATAHST